MKSLCLIALLVAFTGSFSFAETPPRSISVTGTCTRQATPDRGSITVTANFQEASIRDASSKSTRAYENAKAAIQKLNLEHLELMTSTYQLSEVREWEKDKSVFKGYRARIGLRVTTSEVARVGEVIAIGAREGLKETDQLNLFLSDEKAAKERALCLKTAAEDARSKAVKLAEALNTTVGEPLSISESSSHFTPPPIAFGGMESLRASSDAVPAPKLEGGQQTITVNVSVSFALQLSITPQQN